MAKIKNFKIIKKKSYLFVSLGFCDEYIIFYQENERLDYVLH